jgi:mono/diheme cytochrome c family protein
LLIEAGKRCFDRRAQGIVLALEPSHQQEDPFVNDMLKASCAIVVVLMTAGVASAQGQVQVDSGQKVFATQKCSICHSIAGQGNKKGPLEGVGSKLSADEIRQWIVGAPEMAAKVKAERKPAMKAYTSLAKDDIEALVAYVHSLKK